MSPNPVKADVLSLWYFITTAQHKFRDAHSIDDLKVGAATWPSLDFDAVVKPTLITALNDPLNAALASAGATWDIYSTNWKAATPDGARALAVEQLWLLMVTRGDYLESNPPDATVLVNDGAGVVQGTFALNDAVKLVNYVSTDLPDIETTQGEFANLAAAANLPWGGGNHPTGREITVNFPSVPIYP